VASTSVNRVVVLGSGASGKSRFASELAGATGIECVELDTLFWSSELTALAVDDWRELQAQLAAGDRWILDGDLGQYDALEVRLRRADTVVLFDTAIVVCAWRALRRSRERLDFWRWLFTWRRRYRPKIREAIYECAPDAQFVVIRKGTERKRALADLSRGGREA
jgi:nicotinamide riboside kinase